ncbi:RNA-guided endonuclease TnpB family protein [Hydrogenivirga sp. 128-5-R1-1]|uniref:RNA-guided endonuclease InsQ/TnpB family protein n=1 Tax=Hydrogenivirga sp. 128-5-R1-1 TaxID=392423 RepID=UPI00015F1876|nr:RNA-guided endonuclease TnpB family protein [Hydrogenivirga sp. 128-5-R1-1]EDP75525.1 hypothetical protein HG1285_16211 [Hydrogenivirga sp. 128-5-R1-1]
MSRTREEIKFLLTYKFRAYPSVLLEYKMENWLYILCNLYNHALEERKRAWKEEKKTITYSHQQNSLPELKRKDPFLKLVHSQVLQDCLRRVDNAFQKFFRKEAKYPKKKKLSRYNSFTFPQVWMKQKDKLTGDPKLTEVIKLERKNGRFVYLHLPKLGKLKIRLHKQIDWTRAKTVTIKREPSGKWYVCITVEVELEEILREAQERVVGIDLGVKNLATTSEGEFIQHPKFLQKLEKRLKREQKKLSRKKKGSTNWEKQKERLAKIHERIRNARRDFLHKLSRYLVDSYDHISFENLNIKELVQNISLAKLILDAGWGTLITFATYKAVMAGARVVRVDPSYTTQDCSVCGFRVPKTLAERLHECPECGAVMDRDYNASLNILRKGLAHLTGGRVGATRTYACGEGSGGAPSQEGVSHPSLKQESPRGSPG